MPPAFTVSSVKADDLCKNKNTNVPLGPFDGRVAAIHPVHRDYYITTPNRDDIFAPPGPCDVYARMDARYGPDDHTQWPQPFSRSAPYLCCIPLKNALPEEYSIMWWNPTRFDFDAIREHGWDTGIGFLPRHELKLMEECCQQLSKRVDTYQSSEAHRDNHDPLINTFSVNLRRTLSRLTAVAMTRREVLFEYRQVQRQWLELWALMDYIEVHEPHMEGGAAVGMETAKVIGCFVRDADIAERLFSAGIPYWYIRPIATFATENVLSIATVVHPNEMLELDDYIYPFPRIYVGDSNYYRFRAISEHGLKSLRYTDVFSDGNWKGVKPHEFEQAGPTRNHRTPNTRSQPYSGRSKTSGPPASASRDKFDPIDSPYMSLPLESWQKALGAVDRRSEMLFSQKKLAENDGKYAFPEPGIFCSGDNHIRRNRFLTIWTTIRDICIYRLASNAPKVQLLSNQEWRTLLNGRAPNQETKVGTLRLSLTHLLSPEAIQLGVDVSNLHNIPDREFSVNETQENIWGISELSFRFELLMLDRRALDRHLFEGRTQELDLLVREELILQCFYFRPSQPRHLASVSIQNSRHGLASPNIRDRVPYLSSLRRVMFEWVDYHRHHVARLKAPTEETRETDLLHYEYALARFYTQTYFRYFGRAAIIPTTLPHA